MNLTLEEQYLELLNKILYPKDRLGLSIEQRVTEAHALVSAKRKFEHTLEHAASMQIDRML